MLKITDQLSRRNKRYKNSQNARAELHRRFSANPYGWNRWVFDALEKLPAQARILELGCGPAHLWADNAGRIPAGWEITLGDLSDGMIEVARQNLSGVSHPFEFKQFDAQSLPFDDESFDVVVANHMLYHIPDRVKAIAEIWRVLKADGRLVASTVGEQHMQEINLWLRRVSIDPNFKLFAVPFTLENGLVELQTHFRQVEMRRYADTRLIQGKILLSYTQTGLRRAASADTPNASRTASFQWCPQ